MPDHSLGAPSANAARFQVKYLFMFTYLIANPINIWMT